MQAAPRSKRVYLWVPIVFLVFALPSVWLLVTGLADVTEGLVRFTAPGEATITIEDPGSYTVFHEYRSSFEGKVFSGPTTLPGMNIQMVGPGGVTPVVRASTTDFTYNFGSSAGYAVGSIEIERAGEYNVRSAYTSGSGDEVVLALGRGKFLSAFLSVGGIFGLIAAFVFAGLLWMLIFIVRMIRSRAISDLTAQNP